MRLYDIVHHFFQKGGFFIEVGALDGERSSNTLYLEARMGWTGLLIEMDPYYYAQLQAKSRKAWSINACISPHHYPIIVSKRGIQNKNHGSNCLGERAEN